MMALAGAALWLTICVCFAVSAAIIGMPPGSIVYTLAVGSLNVGAIVGAISVVMLFRTQQKYDEDQQFH